MLPELALRAAGAEDLKDHTAIGVQRRAIHGLLPTFVPPRAPLILLACLLEQASLTLEVLGC